MNPARPPTIDPAAALRWAQRVPAASPWLHEEVARRMEQRLQWIKRSPTHWLHWSPLQGGRAAQGLLAARYPQARAHVLERHAAQNQAAQAALQGRGLGRLLGLRSGPVFAAPQHPVQMLWANMALHMEADPIALIRQWNEWLAVDGFVMFSCLGPDTLRELRSLYAALGWPPPSHSFTDMHDWGDMLVHNGFAEPIVDMERITLTYSSPETLLQELRGLGRNLHPQRFAGLRGRGWRAELLRQLRQHLASPSEPGRLELSFEVIYGHAFKPLPRVPVRSEAHISLQAMRQALKTGKTPGRD